MPEELDDGSMLEELNGRLTRLSYRHARLHQDDPGRVWTNDRDNGRARGGTFGDAERYVRHLEHEDYRIAVTP